MYSRYVLWYRGYGSCLPFLSPSSSLPFSISLTLSSPLLSPVRSLPAIFDPVFSQRELKYRYPQWSEVYSFRVEGGLSISGIPIGGAQDVLVLLSLLGWVVQYYVLARPVTFFSSRQNFSSAGGRGRWAGHFTSLHFTLHAPKARRASGSSRVQYPYRRMSWREQPN